MRSAWPTQHDATYKTELRGVIGSGPKTVSGKYRKARGKADGIILRARKVGTSTFAEIGRFTAPTFHVLIPMTGTEPEQWEIQGQVFAKDQPFGLPSDIVEVIVKP